MCGIVGFSGRFDYSKLDGAVAMLAHRGPDDQGVFRDQGAAVGLGHTRLSILDLSSGGHQPMTSHDGQVTVVFNGEIYNFESLKARLVSLGCKFRGGSDTEVLLSLYLQDGIAAVKQLNGIFAFAIWDQRVSRLFHTFRPLYY